MNHNIRVDVPGATYVLKRYEPRLYKPERVQRTCEVQTAEACYVLSAFINGRHHKRRVIPPRAAHGMGQTLGQMMQAMAELQPVESYLVPDPAEFSSHLKRLLREAERGTLEVDNVAGQVLHYKLGALERLKHWFASLPVQWVHDDYQDTNVLFDVEDRVVAVIDFDNLRCRPRAWEFMRAFDYCFSAGADGREDFFRGYAKVVRPNRAEVGLYAPLWAYLSVTTVWPIETRYLEPEVYQSRWDRFIHPPSDWWERNMEAVTDQLLTWQSEAVR